MTSVDWVEPALATLVKAVPDGPGWVFEHKHDGIRCLAHRNGDDVALFTRNRNPISDETVAEALRGQAMRDLVVDGELVGGHFGRDETVGFHVFDLLRLDGRRTTDLALRDRRRLLLASMDWVGPLLPVDQTSGPASGQALYDEAAASGWEGIVAKRADSTYTSGRSRDWLKVKCVEGQELVIGGFTEPSGSRVGLGAVLVGHFDETGFRYAGKVGTGFTDAVLIDLRARLDRHLIDESPFVDLVRAKGAHWVAPELVCDVEFTEWTGDGRLRHPSFKGLRSDKPAAAVTRERPT